MSKTLVIIGAGGHGKVAAECAELSGLYSNIVFLDEAYPEKQSVEHWPILSGFESEISRLDASSDYFVAVGNSAIRKKLVTMLKVASLPLISLIHPTAVVSNYAVLGSGTLVCAGAVVNPFVSIGVAGIVNTNASIDHDCVIGDFVHIAPGCALAGDVSVGDLTFVGAGVTVIQGKVIGTNTTVGAGAVVISDIPSDVTVVGIPAKVLS